jgi:hypothetical protein
MIIVFKLDKQTKNTIRYAEVENPPLPTFAHTEVAVGMLYIQKTAVTKLRPDGLVPQQITVEIKAS